MDNLQKYRDILGIPPDVIDDGDKYTDEEIEHSGPIDDSFIMETRKTWCDILGRPVDDECAKEIIGNMTALAQLFVGFDKRKKEGKADG
jgi:hypothetical protein